MPRQRQAEINGSNEMLTTRNEKARQDIAQSFLSEFQVTWSDLDYNRHLKNTAYIDYAAQTRFLYFSSIGFGPEDFASHGIGPVVLNDSISYRRELAFLQPFKVEMLCGGANAKRSKYVAVNRFRGMDGQLHAEIKSLFVWFDLKHRKAVTGPRALLDGMDALPRTEDFAVLD